MFAKSVLYEDDLKEWLQDPENAAGYLTAVLEENDPDALLIALRDVAKARGGMAAIAERTHIRRETLYKMLSDKANPAFKGVASILRGMGLELAVKPITESHARPRVACV
jgi:probable addiction module antidote protein